jgi:hypothetical protein
MKNPVVAIFSIVLACGCSNGNKADKQAVGGSAGSAGQAVGGQQTVTKANDAGRAGNSGSPLYVGGNQTGSAGADGNGGNADAGQPKCLPAVVGTPTKIVDPEQGSVADATFTWADGRVVAVWPSAGGRGYRVGEFDEDGAIQGGIWTAWLDASSQAGGRIAVSNGVLALLVQVGEGVNQRPSCRLGLARLKEREVLQDFILLSDSTEDDSILHETQQCDVVSTQSGFVAVWQQAMSRTSDSASLFAQRVGLDGTLQGERVVLASDLTVKRAELAVTRDAARAVVAYRDAKQTNTTLAFIDAAEVRRTELALKSPLQTISAVHDGFAVQTYDELLVLDSTGASERGPIALPIGTLVGALGEGYVAVHHDEFLVARSIDGTLGLWSEPVGISENRSASARALVYAPDGSSTALICADGRFVRLGCGDSIDPPGPKRCPEVSELRPLDPGCGDAVCHGLVRFDYLTLGVLGWSVRGGAVSPVDAAGASLAAQTVFDAKGEYLGGETKINGPTGGLFTAYISPMDFGAFALVGAQSGVVVAAGGIIWAGHGRYWVPDKWNSAADIACGTQTAQPASEALDQSTCEGTTRPGTTARQAMDVALRTNLAASLAARGPFAARAYLYMPSVGACNPGAAEWLVVLTQAQP